MADDGKVPPEEVSESTTKKPGAVSDSSSSDDATSTKSTELKTPDDESALQSETSGHDSGQASGGASGQDSGQASGQASGRTSPARHSSESVGSREASRSQSPEAEPPQCGGIPAEAPEEQAENVALIQRRRVREHPDDDIEELEAIQPVAEQVVIVEPARRSPTRPFLTSLTRGFENSNDYFINFLLKWQAYSIFLSDSRYLVLPQLCLIGLSVTNVVIGSMYWASCPAAPFLPGLVLVLGMFGTLAMVFRMILVIYKYNTTRETYTKFLRKVVQLLNIVYLSCLAWEVTEYTMCKNSSTDPASAEFCHPFVLQYIQAYNCWAYGIILFSFILHGPAYLQYSWHIGGPGLIDSRA